MVEEQGWWRAGRPGARFQSARLRPHRQPGPTGRRGRTGGSHAITFHVPSLGKVHSVLTSPKCALSLSLMSR